MVELFIYAAKPPKYDKLTFSKLNVSILRSVMILLSIRPNNPIYPKISFFPSIFTFDSVCPFP